MVEYSTMDDTFGALADPTRRSIVNQLMAGPLRVTEIAQPYSMSLNSVSKHLRILERAKLVRREIRGRDHWMHFNQEPLTHARNWADSVLRFWGSRLDTLEGLLEADKENDR